MDLSDYRNKLTQEERLLLWQEFQAQPGWLLLKAMFLRDQVAIPDITDCDSEKAFIFKQAKLKGVAEVLNRPNELIENIARGINRA